VTRPSPRPLLCDPSADGGSNFAGAIAEVVPPLRDLGRLVQTVEQRNGILFLRMRASVRTNLVDAEPQIRGWIVTAL
jgi:hypothetical protein